MAPKQARGAEGSGEKAEIALDLLLPGPASAKETSSRPSSFAKASLAEGE